MELEKRLRIEFPAFRLQEAGKQDTIVFFENARESVRNGLMDYLSTRKPKKYLGEPAHIVREYMGILPYGRHDPFGREAIELTNAEYRKHKDELIGRLGLSPEADDRTVAREASKAGTAFKPYSIFHMLAKASIYMKNFEVPEFYRRFENGRSIRITAEHDKGHKGVDLLVQMKPWFNRYI